MERQTTPHRKNIDICLPENLIQNNDKPIHGCPVYEVHEIATPNLSTPAMSALQYFAASNNEFIDGTHSRQVSPPITAFTVDETHGNVFYPTLICFIVDHFS